MKNENGLTLVEVIAAIAILSIVILSFTQLSSNGRLSDVQSEHINEANHVIEEIINDIRSEFPTSKDLQKIIESNELKYNNLYSPKYRFNIQISSASKTINFINPCSSNDAQTSIPFTIFNNNATYLLSITACWSK